MIVAFDYDGTLVRSNSSILDIYKTALAKIGVPFALSEKELESCFGRRYEEIYRITLEKAGAFTPSNMKLLKKVHLQELQCFDFHKGVVPIRGAGETLNALKENGFKIAVATGNTRIIFEQIQRDIDLHTHFDFTVCDDEVTRGKPDPKMLNRIMQHFGVMRTEMIYVGDSPVDIQTAKNAGVKSVAVLTGAMDRNNAEESGADFIINDVTKINDVLNELEN